MRIIFSKEISAWGLSGSQGQWFLGLLGCAPTNPSKYSVVLKSEYDALVSELEIERMRLAACGVVATSDTKESALMARDMKEGYNSAYCQDVARKVDELLDLRTEATKLSLDLLDRNAEVLKLKQEISRLNSLLSAQNQEILESKLKPTYKEGTQYVVCAAARNTLTGEIICSPRHYDGIFHQTANSREGWPEADQGFVDQYGNFLTRAQAHKLATENNQIKRRVGGDHEELYSENLY